MATTVEGAFSTYFSRINLDGDHRADANNRREVLINILQKKFHILDSFAFGSIPRFTALKEGVDVDVMVVLHWEKHIKGKTPVQVLQDVRDALGEHRNNVRKNGQAVTLYYKTPPNVDVVPASRVMNNGVFSHYTIPDTTTGQWLETNPKDHSDDIDAKSAACGQNFRRIIKMAKHWNKTHGDILTGYHLEVLALQTFSTDLSDTPWSVLRFFSENHPKLLGQLWHRRSYVDGYLSAGARADVFSRWQTAQTNARLAWYYGSERKPKEAIEYWQKVFGEKFPGYGA